MNSHRSGAGTSGRYLAGTVVAGLAVTALLMYFTISVEIGELEKRHAAQAAVIKDTIARRVRAADEGLHGLQTLFNSQLQVEAEQFNLFATNLLLRYPFVKSIYYLPLIAAGDRADFEQQQRAAGYAEFSINKQHDKHSIPAAGQPRYFPILYLEPMDPAEAGLLGFDALGDTQLAPAVMQTIDSGESAVSFPNPLQPNSRGSYLVFKGIYAGMTQPAAPEARRSTVNGLLALVIDINKLVADTPVMPDMEFELALQHSTAKAGEVLAIERGKDFDNSSRQVLSTFSVRNQFAVSGYGMTVTTRGHAHWGDITTWPVLSVGLAGLIFTGLLTFIARSVIARAREIHERNALVEAMVNERTRELAVANDALRQTAGALDQEKKEQQSLIAKLQAAQSQLLQSEKMASIGQLAAGVAHEINNPVGFVNSNLGALEKYAADLLRLLDVYQAAEHALPAAGQELASVNALKKEIEIQYLREDMGDLIRESKDGLDRVKKIVQDLKDFSHVDNVQVWQSADLQQCLESTLNVVRNEIKYKAEVFKNYGVLPEVECLPSQINQVFVNLLVNAAHAIAGRGAITLSSGVEGDWVWVAVADTGCGIAPETLKRIFDPFFTTKPVGQGTGLGLSVSYSIIKTHGGRIEVESVVGAGTTFRIWLPVKRAAAQAA